MDRKRPSAKQRGYDRAHFKLRRLWQARVDAGVAYCARCGRWLPPGSPFDLGHVDGTSEYAGAECRSCNRATNTPGRVTSARRWSRRW